MLPVLAVMLRRLWRLLLVLAVALRRFGRLLLVLAVVLRRFGRLLPVLAATLRGLLARMLVRHAFVWSSFVTVLHMRNDFGFDGFFRLR